MKKKTNGKLNSIKNHYSRNTISFNLFNFYMSSSLKNHRVCNKSNTTGATCGARTAYLS